MKCSELKNLIFEYMENKLEDEDKKEFAAHMLTCKKCLKDFDETAKSITLFKQLKEVPFPEKIDNNVFPLVEIDTDRQQD